MFIVATLLTVAVNQVWYHVHELRLLVVLPYLILAFLLIYSVCKIKKLIGQNAVYLNPRNKRMTVMIVAFFIDALQMAASFPLNYMYEREGNYPKEYYLELDTIFIAQCIVGFSVGSLLQLLIIWILFDMIPA